MPDITWPSGGVDRAFGFHQQPPYTTYDARNVRTIDVFDNRARGGVRPGVTKHHATQFGSGNPVRALVKTAIPTTGVPILVLVSNGTLRYETAIGTWSGTVHSPTGASNTGRICIANMGDITYFLQAGQTYPFYFDASSNNASGFSNASGDVATLGQVPSNCKAIAQHLGRLYMSAKSDAPRAYFGCKIDTPVNWLVDGLARDHAFSGSYTVRGATNDVVTALIPWAEDNMLFCGKSSMKILYGDPMYTGYFRDYSFTFGSHDAMSWCRGPGNAIYLMNSAGLIRCRPGQAPELLSTKVRKLLAGIDPATYEISMGWDVRRELIRIAITKTSSSAGVLHWCLDLRTDALWPDTCHVDVEPFCFCHYPELTDVGTDLIYGTRTGYVRRDSDSTATDDGNNFDSYIMLGPFTPFKDGYYDGIVDQVIGRLAESSGSANFSVHVGDTADEAAAASAWYTATLAAGFNPTEWVQARCCSFFIKVYGTAGTRWALEKLTVTTLPGDKARQLL